MKFLNTALLLLFSLLNTRIYSQEPAMLDSVKKLMQASSDTTKVNGYTGMASLIVQKEPEEAKKYLYKAKELSKKINFRRGEANAHLFFGTYYALSANYDSALYYNTLATNIYEQLNAQAELHQAYYKRGSVFVKMNKPDDAISTYKKALDIGSMVSAFKSCGFTCMAIASIYSETAKHDEAINYFIKARKYFEKAKFIWGEFMCLNNMTSVYRVQKRYSEAVANYKKVLDYCLSKNELTNAVIVMNNLGSTYLQMDDLKESEKWLLATQDTLLKYPAIDYRKQNTLNLGDLYQVKKDYGKAEKYYLEVKKLFEADNDPRLRLVLQNLASVYEATGRTKQAIEMFRRNETLHWEYGLNRQLGMVYSSLAGAYFTAGDYKKAYEYEHKGSLLKDTIYQETTSEKIAEMEAVYQNEKKEKEIQLKNQELVGKEAMIREQNLQKMLFAGGSIVLLGVGVLLYRGNRMKRKANNLLVFQKQEIIQQKEIIETKNKDITDSIQYAKRLQEAVLPIESQLSKYFKDSFILFKPKDIVSGDFYWFEQSEDKIVIAVADCTGHGVPGAFMSILGNNLLNQIVLEQKITQPSHILSLLDQRVGESLNKQGQSHQYNDGMDISILVYERNTGRAAYAGANRPILVKRNDELIEYKPTKHAVGGITTDSIKFFSKQEFTVNEGDQIYMFTDGYADQFGGEQGKKFKYKRLLELISNLPTVQMQEQKQILDNSFESWKGSLEQLDDVCVVGVKF
jgi:serine phosphatase RsbU (regulator of sigma subunit)